MTPKIAGKGLFLVIIFLVGRLIAQVSVTLPTVSGTPGTIVSAPITVTNLSGYHVTSYGFQLNYDNNIIYITGVTTSGTISSGALVVPNPDTLSGFIKVGCATGDSLSGAGILLNLKIKFRNVGTTTLSFGPPGDAFKFNSGTPTVTVNNGSATTQSTTNVYTVATYSNPINGGTTSGDGTYNEGQSVTVVATPHPGFSFINWTENSQVVSTNASYTFTINSNRSLVANFAAQYSVSTISNPPEGGTTSGDGVYTEGQTVTVTATPNNGYTFIYWLEGSNVVSTNLSYTFTITSNVNLVARFDRPPVFTISMPDTIIKVHNVPVEFSFQYKANDPDGDTLAFSLVEGPAGSFINNSNGLFKWTPTIEQAGKQFTVTVSISDGLLTTTTTSIVSTDSTIVNVIRENRIPNEFKLMQNYPNPFNPSTTIEFEIPKQTHVLLKVYDVLGQQVAELINKDMSPGSYRINFDAYSLHSGIYFYTLIVNEGQFVKKMIVAK